MTLGPKSEKILKKIIAEGPQHISEIKRCFGAGSRQSAEYLKKVGVLKRDETDTYFLSSSSYTDIEEVEQRVVEWRAEQREAGEKPIPPTMLDNITSGMAETGHTPKKTYRLKKSVRKRVMEQLKITEGQLLDAEKLCTGDMWFIPKGNVITNAGYLLIINDGSEELLKLIMPTNCFVGHGNEESEE